MCTPMFTSQILPPGSRFAAIGHYCQIKGMTPFVETIGVQFMEAAEKITTEVESSVFTESHAVFVATGLGLTLLGGRSCLTARGSSNFAWGS